jgi:hypothetical protein
MILYGYIKKSKPKKLSKAAKQQHEDWLDSLKKQTTNFSKTKSIKIVKSVPSPKVPPGRETPRYDSLDTGMIACTKPVDGNTYTGTKMLGIGTLHKSNAVPVFNNDEAVDMAKMRR